MKYLSLIITLFIGLQGFSQDDVTSNLDWLLDLEEAKTESVASKKPILIYFTGSDWCAPCKMLKKDFFSSKEFEEKSEHFVLLMVDMPRRKDVISKAQQTKNYKVVSKYNKNGSYPTLVALNENGNVIGELSGYTFLRETDRHFAFVDSILENY